MTNRSTVHFRSAATLAFIIAFSFLLPLSAFAENDLSEVVADSGFRPNPNGFSFENWGGNEYPDSDLTADDAVTLFGDDVCARWDGDDCVPTPAAELWVERMNAAMKGGHCEGMAAMSAAFYTKAESLSDYGAKQTYALKPDDAELLRAISQYFVTQSLEPVQSETSATKDYSLQEIVDGLIKTLSSKEDAVTLGIYYPPVGGHAITPYKVERRGTTEYRVYVYDNNYPGVEKYVDIDVANDEWEYSGAALNPKEDAAPWSGGSGMMDFTPLSLRMEDLECPFCGNDGPPSGKRPAKAPQPPKKPVSDSDEFTIITPNRCSQIQATRKKDKKQLVKGAKAAKNEIKGASMSPLRGSRGCVVHLPKDEEYEVELVEDGMPNFSPTTELVVFVSGMVYDIANIALSQSGPQTITFDDDTFTFESEGSQSPRIRIAEDGPESDGAYEVDGFTIGDGYSFTVNQDKDGDIAFSDTDPNVDTYDIDAESVDDDDTEEMHFEDVTPGEHGRAMLDLDEKGDIDLDIDSDSDGTEDEADADDDNDGTPDASDTDDDGDGLSDDKEATDFDHDSIPDDRDGDDDNDGIADATDADDHTVEAGDEDSDHDGVIDEADGDDDNDGKADSGEDELASGGSHSEEPEVADDASDDDAIEEDGGEGDDDESSGDEGPADGGEE